MSGCFAILEPKIYEGRSDVGARFSVHCIGGVNFLQGKVKETLNSER